MKQLSKHQVNKLTAKELQANLPFQILADGEVIAVVLPVTDVNLLKKKSTKDKRRTAKVTPLIKRQKELLLSKARQARCELSRNPLTKP